MTCKSKYKVFQKGNNYFNFFVALKMRVTNSPICEDNFLSGFLMFFITNYIYIILTSL